jgi:hypothetical protein
LPQQILRHLDGIYNCAIGTYEAKPFPELVRPNSLVVEAFDFNIYAITNLAPITGPD